MMSRRVRKFRIKVEEISDDKKHKHQFQVTIFANSAKTVKKKIEASFGKEIDIARQEFINYLVSRKASLVEEIIRQTEEDLIDWKSKGKDISRVEFLQNEIDLESGKYS